MASAPALVCATAEIALNRYLRLEPGVIEECARLDGQSIEISLPSRQLSIVIEFTPSGVRVMPEPVQRPQVSVIATPSALLRALRSSSGITAGLEVDGDAELLERFAHMIRTVGFDPEEWIAPLFGDALAHRLADGLNQMLGWFDTSSRRMADHTAEYLREESYDLARDRDASQWMDDVDALRESLDRAEARLSRIEKKRGTADENAD